MVLKRQRAPESLEGFSQIAEPHPQTSGPVGLGGRERADAIGPGTLVPRLQASPLFPLPSHFRALPRLLSLVNIFRVCPILQYCALNIFISKIW